MIVGNKYVPLHPKQHMRKILFLVCSVVILTGMTPDDGVITKEDGMYVVNTTKLADDVIGYEGPTPLKIYIKKNKVVRIEALPNKETPRYFAAAKKWLLDKWNGMTVKEAAVAEVDGKTGATYSSDAIKENVRRGVTYYKKKRSK